MDLARRVVLSLAPSALLAPAALDVIDTTKGTVQMVIGGGGTSSPSNELFFNPPRCRVITAVGQPNPSPASAPRSM